MLMVLFALVMLGICFVRWREGAAPNQYVYGGRSLVFFAIGVALWAIAERAAAAPASAEDAERIALGAALYQAFGGAALVAAAAYAGVQSAHWAAALIRALRRGLLN